MATLPHILSGIQPPAPGSTEAKLMQGFLNELLGDRQHRPEEESAAPSPPVASPTTICRVNGSSHTDSTNAPAPSSSRQGIAVSNSEFLTAIAGDRLRANELFWTTNFSTKPATAGGAGWKGTLSTVDEADEVNPDHNAYFSVSAFPETAIARSKANAIFVLTIVVDDAGKDGRTMPDLPASWILQTSLESTQHGFILSERVTADDVAPLHHWLGKNGHLGGDRSGHNPVRYARLPVQTNNKYDPPFAGILTSWQPARRYTLAEIEAAFGMKSAPAPVVVPRGTINSIATGFSNFTLPSTISEGGRNETLFKLGCSLRAKGAEATALRTELLRINMERCQPPLGAVEVETIAASCSKFDRAPSEDKTANEGRLVVYQTFSGNQVQPHKKPVHAHVTNFRQFIRRYIYIENERQYVDRITGEVLTVENLNDRKHHIGWKRDKHGKPTDEPLFGRHDHFTQALSKNLRQRVYSRTYLPGGEEVVMFNRHRCLNMWAPTDLNPREGDPTRWLNLARRLFPREDEREHLLDWMAYVVQHPIVKPNHHPLIGGDKHGQGKDTFIIPLKQSIGAHNVGHAGPAELNTAFNSFVERRLVVINELKEERGINAAASMANRLKHLCASPPEMHTVNPKFGKQYQIPNINAVIAFTNHRDAFGIDAHERRWFCLWTDAEPLMEADMFDIHGWYDEGGNAIVYYYLLHRDVTKFNPYGKAPITEHRAMSVQAGVNDIGLWLDDRINMTNAITSFVSGRLSSADLFNSPIIAAKDAFSILKSEYEADASGQLRKYMLRDNDVATALSRCGWRSLGRFDSGVFQDKYDRDVAGKAKTKRLSLTLWLCPEHQDAAEETNLQTLARTPKAKLVRYFNTRIRPEGLRE